MLCVIVISQFDGFRGRSPRSRARRALTKVVWVDILGVGVVAEHGIGVAIHLCRVVPVEVVEGPGRGHA